MLDVPGAVLGTVGLLSLVFGITRTGNQDSSGQPYGWSDPLAITGMLLGVALLAAFVFLETRTKHPIMPLTIFKSRTRAVAFLSMMITPAAMFAMFFFLSLYIQNVMGYAPLRAGFAFLPFCFGMVFGAALASKLMTRVDPRFICRHRHPARRHRAVHVPPARRRHRRHRRAAGGTGWRPPRPPVSYWADLMPFIILMSFGMGMTFVPIMMAAVHGVRAQDAGIGSGVLNTMQQVGGALGLAVLSTVAAHYTPATSAPSAPRSRGSVTG